jgi:hypothetical protein
MTTAYVVVNSSLGANSAAPLFQPTYDGEIFDFFLNCSYTTYDVEYSMINGTTQPDFSFAPTPNGSVAEEWHGRQEYVSLTGDPSGGLVQNNFIAAKQPTPDDFARAWANLYSIRVLSVIGAYTDPRPNIQEQVRDQLVVTRIVPWTLGFLLSVNFTYAVLGMVVGALAWGAQRTPSWKLCTHAGAKKALVGIVLARAIAMTSQLVCFPWRDASNFSDFFQKDERTTSTVRVCGEGLLIVLLKYCTSRQTSSKIDEELKYYTTTTKLYYFSSCFQFNFLQK